MLDIGTIPFILLVVSIIAVCAFEFINGFHDTANAVATVIYTKSLKPNTAVGLSGAFNFLGVLTGVFGGLGVAMGIIKLLPLNDMMAQSMGENMAIIMAILIAAIIWNLGTWYFGIPSSSSHTLIGALVGAGIVFGWKHGGDGVSTKKMMETFWSLLLSPAIGLLFAGGILYLLSWWIGKNHKIFESPNDNDNNPPAWYIRFLLIFTCVGVSYAHGSNDGQKGIGLVMIILMTFIPAQFSLSPKFDFNACEKAVISIEQALSKGENHAFDKELKKVDESLLAYKAAPEGKNRFKIRKALSKLSTELETDIRQRDLTKEQIKAIKSPLKEIKSYVEFAPIWVILMISLSLGLGTMIGWERIVTTIGEKIGKTHMTYAQGMVSQLVAGGTIAFSTFVFKLPVSTTHILSSSVAGSMVAFEGVKNLQSDTIKSIAMSWVLTLPITIILSGALYYLFGLFV